MHSSWLAINPIIGCPNGCKYYSLQTTNDNNCLPKQIVTTKEAVKQLLEYKNYDKDISVCLLSNPDTSMASSFKFLEKAGKNIGYVLMII